MRSVSLLLLAITLSLSVPSVSVAAPGGAKFPEKPITFVVPYAAGGSTDLTGRALVEAAKPYFAQPFMILNRGGGAGSVGIAEVMRAKPDGYTVAMGSITSTILLPQINKLPYKGPGDFTPVIKLVNQSLVLAVRAEQPWGSLKQMLEAAKANPEKVRIGQGGGGTGSIYHLVIEMLKVKAGVNVIHVPFASGGEVTTALLGNHIEAIVIAFSVIAGQVKAGKLRVLTTFEEKRNSLFPNVPTASEEGYDITQGLYFYVLTAKGTPDQVVKILHDGFKKATETESFQNFTIRHGNVVDYKGSAELKRELERDFSLFGDLLKKVDLKGK